MRSLSRVETKNFDVRVISIGAHLGGRSNAPPLVLRLFGAQSAAYSASKTTTNQKVFNTNILCLIKTNILVVWVIFIRVRLEDQNSAWDVGP